jgi:hypothetical protein
LRSLWSIAAAVSLWLLIEGASAQAPSVTSTIQRPADEAAINIVAQKLCQGEPVIGTRLAAKRKCDTPAQLAHYREQAREFIEEYKRRPCMAGTGTGPNDTPMSC